MLLQLADLTFGYAGEELFLGLTWQINPGEHIGLVGPNGAGKSTLLRLMAGQIEPEAGQVARRRGVTIGYLHQSQEFAGAGTILHALLAPFADVTALHDEMVELAARLERTHDDKDLERYGHVEEQFRHKDGYALEARVRELAMDVGFGEDELGRSVETLSGGERNRLELAKVLLAAPDLLLLDEPTNHLDMAACERLEGFLKGFPGAFVLVSLFRRRRLQGRARPVGRRAQPAGTGQDDAASGEPARARRADQPPRHPRPRGPGAGADDLRGHAARGVARPLLSRRGRHQDARPRRRRRRDPGARQRLRLAPSPRAQGRHAGGETGRRRRDRAEEGLGGCQRAGRRARQAREAARRAGGADRQARGRPGRHARAAGHGGDWQKLHKLVEEERRQADRLRSLLGEWEKLGESLSQPA